MVAKLFLNTKFIKIIEISKSHINIYIILCFNLGLLIFFFWNVKVRYWSEFKIIQFPDIYRVNKILCCLMNRDVILKKSYFIRIFKIYIFDPCIFVTNYGRYSCVLNVLLHNMNFKSTLFSYSHYSEQFSHWVFTIWRCLSINVLVNILW